MKHKYSVLYVLAILAPLIIADQHGRVSGLTNEAVAKPSMEIAPRPSWTVHGAVPTECVGDSEIIANSRCSFGLEKVAQKAMFYMIKEYKYNESDLDICAITHRKIHKKSKNTKKSDINNVEYYWVWEVSFVLRENIGKVLGGGFKVVMTDAPNLDLIKIHRGK